MTQPLIRPAIVEDIVAITEIYQPAVVHGTASFELNAPDVAEMRRRFETITEAGYPYLVADAATRVVGYGYANAFRARPAYRYSVEDSIYVAPDWHRRGAGRALLAALIAACTERGFRQMIAMIGDSSQQASIGLHRALGFSLRGTIQAVGFKHGRWLDTVVMQRPLGDGDRTPPSDLSST